MAEQLGFYLDLDRCIQCHACELVCKTRHDLEAGVTWRHVAGLWSGAFPNPIHRTISYACMHCGRPACAEVCPVEAISKRPDDGIVLVDRDACTGCGACAEACPFGIPQFDQDGAMSKCDLCVDRLGQGLLPLCVTTCPSEALLFGSLEELHRMRSASGRAPIRQITDATSPSMLVSSVEWAALEPLLPWKRGLTGGSL